MKKPAVGLASAAFIAAEFIAVGFIGTAFDATGLNKPWRHRRPVRHN